MSERSQTTLSAPKPYFTPIQPHLLQRKCACGGSPGPDGECAECREKRLQRRSTGQTEPSTVPPIVHEVLRSPGQPIDLNTRTFMESRFGHDFSHVRVHAGAKATESAKAMSALAYTVGQDVVFGQGQYVPGAVEGKRLLAHELTHTMQQSIQSPNISGLRLAAANDAPEQEARRAENQFVAGSVFSRIGLAPVQTSVQRACGPNEVGEVTGCIGRGGDISDFGSTSEDWFLFQVDCDLFQPGEKARLEEYAREIGSEEIVAIDGFASEEGMPEFNERLSCARAHAAASVLFAAGVQPSQIEIYMHGATPGMREFHRSVAITVIPAVPAGPTPTEQATALADEDCAEITRMYDARRLDTVGLFLQIYRCLTCSFGAAIRRGIFEDPLWLARVNHLAFQRLQEAFSAPNTEYQRAFSPCNTLDRCLSMDIDFSERLACQGVLEGFGILQHLQSCTERIGGVHLKVDLRYALGTVGCASPANKRDYARVVPLFQSCNLAILSSEFPIGGETVAERIAIPRITEQRNAAWSAAGCP
jgi:outer membrane protein OmpA-like peptidoglycan-associated protein